MSEKDEILQALERLTSPERLDEVKRLATQLHEWLRATNYAVAPDLTLPGFLRFTRVWELGRVHDPKEALHLVMTRKGHLRVYHYRFGFRPSDPESMVPRRAFGFPEAAYGIFLEDVRRRVAEFMA